MEKAQRADHLNLIHCEVQELQARGVRLTYVNYDTLYSMIERIRDEEDI